MSAELPKVSSDYVSNRLEQLERRLEQAKQARDNYIEFLKQTQNEANNEQPTQQNQFPGGQSLAGQRPGLMRRLETGQYFWNFQNQPENYSLRPLPTNEPVPRGMVLSSDLNSMTKRLREIGSSIRNLRDYRLSMPTDEYFKSVRPHLHGSEKFSSYYGDPDKADLPSLAEIRSRILSMQFNVEKRTRELLDQRPATQQIAVVTQPSLSTISNIVKVNQEKAPEWLKQKDFEEELKKMNASHLIEAQKKIEVNEKPQIDLPHSQILKEPKVEEKPVIISSNRQILFGSNTVDQQEESEPSRPENSKEQYNRMLDILRPKQVSSSDEDATPLSQQKSSGQQAPSSVGGKLVEASSSKSLPTFLQTPAVFSTPSQPTQKPSLAQALKSANLSDDDSDFFK